MAGLRSAGTSMVKPPDLAVTWVVAPLDASGTAESVLLSGVAAASELELVVLAVGVVALEPLELVAGTSLPPHAVMARASGRRSGVGGICAWRPSIWAPDSPMLVRGTVSGRLSQVRLVIAQCQVDYAGRLTAHLPMAKRLIMVKSDTSVSIHADDRAYKPLNWMSPPCTMTVQEVLPGTDLPATTDDVDAHITQVWDVTGPHGDTLKISIGKVFHDSEHEFGVDPGLQKDGVEAHLQALLAENPTTFGEGYRLVQREFFTPIGPVDLLLRSDEGQYVAVEVKRRGEIDGVEQLTRYLELMNRDPQMAPVAGVFAAQQIKPQARTLAADRGITCVTVNYDELRGLDNPEDRLF